MSKPSMKRSSSSTIHLFPELWKFLSRKRKKQLIGLQLIMVASAFGEVVSLASIYPFLSLLTEPNIQANRAIEFYLSLFPETTRIGLVYVSTLVLCSATLATALLRILNIWLNGRLSARVGSDLSAISYQNILYQDYETHMSYKSSQIINSVTNQTDRTVNAITSLLQLMTAVTIAIALTVGLFTINIVIAGVLLLIFGIIYILLAYFSRKRLAQNSYHIATATAKQIQSLQEGLGAIRNIILENSQHTYVATYKSVDWPKRSYLANNKFTATYPRYALESLGIVVIASIGFIIYSNNPSDTTIIPMLGVISLGCQRLLPSLQQIYGNWASLGGFHADVAGVLSLLKLQPIKSPVLIKRSDFNQLRLHDVSFRYSGSTNSIIRNVNLTINNGEKIGIIGPTGSGKSTLIDLMMGLLSPTKGIISVNNKPLYDPLDNELLYAYRSSVAHVPQNTYLTDSSIAQNIAFTLDEASVDMACVRESAKLACIADFINSLPDGYQTNIGEQGVLLSGGQRQRLAIARALYRRARLLILDEATSALDGETEARIIRNIELIQKDTSLIMIAHRLSTLRCCDRVLQIKDGSIFPATLD